MEDLMNSLVPVVAVLSTIALPIATGLILGLKKLSSAHKERMGMIQQGIIPPNEPKRTSTPNRYRSLRNGVILIALGIGIIVGFLGTNYLIIGENNPDLFIIASIVLFLGIGYTVFFWITNNSNINNGVNAENNIEEDFE